MYDKTILVCAIVTTVATLLLLLPLFGFDLRFKSKTTSVKQQIFKPRKRDWLSLIFSILGFLLSGYSVYLELHPKIVEKIIEKPVDRVVVQQCPQVPCKAETHGRPAKAAPPQTLINSPAPVPVTASNGSIAIGSVSGNGNTVNPSVTNMTTPARTLTEDDKAQIKAHILPTFHSKVRLWSSPSAPDSYIYAVQLKNALKAAGANVDEDIQLGEFTNGTVLYGVQVQIHGDEMPVGTRIAIQPTSDAGMLLYALYFAHVEIGATNVTSKIPKDILEIMVGFNPADKPK